MNICPPIKSERNPMQAGKDQYSISLSFQEKLGRNLLVFSVHILSQAKQLWRNIFWYILERSHTFVTLAKKEYQHQENPMNHRKIYTGKKPDGCHVCIKGFSSKSILKTHYEIHNKNLKVNCNGIVLCGPLRLKVHMW